MQERGQSTLELALLLPLLVTITLLVVQIGLIARDRVAVAHAARAAAREAVVDPRPDVVRAAATASTSLDAAGLQVTVLRQGDDVAVTVVYRAPTDVPLVGRWFGGVTVRERLVGRSE